MELVTERSTPKKNITQKQFFPTAGIWSRKSSACELYSQNTMMVILAGVNGIHAKCF